jgi:hypothetical protein
MTTVKVTSPAELLDALATADDIDVVGSLTGMPMITLRPGVTLRGGTLRFGAKGVPSARSRGPHHRQPQGHIRRHRRVADPGERPIRGQARRPGRSRPRRPGRRRRAADGSGRHRWRDRAGDARPDQRSSRNVAASSLICAADSTDASCEFLYPAAIGIGYCGHRLEQHQRQAELTPKAQVHRGLEPGLDVPHVTEHPPQLGHVDLVP